MKNMSLRSQASEKVPCFLQQQGWRHQQETVGEHGQIGVQEDTTADNWHSPENPSPNKKNQENKILFPIWEGNDHSLKPQIGEQIFQNWKIGTNESKRRPVTCTSFSRYHAWYKFPEKSVPQSWKLYQITLSLKRQDLQTMFKLGNKTCKQLRRTRWPLLRTCPPNLGNGRNKWACGSFAWMNAVLNRSLY